MRAFGIWAGLLAAIIVPVALALDSPLLAWREPVYVIAGIAGVVGLALLVVQPLMAIGALPGIGLSRGRRIHRVIGLALVGAVIVHVAGLWITSPPDVVDALLLSSPTQFSVWGVIAMWSVFAAATMAAFRRRLRLRPKTWRFAHLFLVTLTVPSVVAHTVLIDGTMEDVSKVALCIVAGGALIFALLRIFRRQRRA